MRNTKDNKGRTGRPSSGEYGTTENISEYRRSYNSHIDPEKLLQYRLRQAYNLLREHGEKYGYSVEYNNPISAIVKAKSPQNKHEETNKRDEKTKNAKSALDTLLEKL